VIRQPGHEDTTVGRRVLLDAAYSYIESSPQFPMFPVDPATKHPLIKLGRDFAEGASTDPAQIEHWILHRFPECGIATPTGAASGAVVIDVDRKHDGEELLAALEHALGPLPRVRVNRCRRYHRCGSLRSRAPAIRHPDHDGRRLEPTTTS
jgi:Bifunctional DNA primase/polymerase, N-terminal